VRPLPTVLDLTNHKSYTKLMKRYVHGQIPTKTLAEVDVLHDDWCGNYADGDSPATRRSEALPIRLVPSVTTVR
jgi:hypothetical protein